MIRRRRVFTQAAMLVPVPTLRACTTHAFEVGLELFGETRASTGGLAEERA